MADFNTTAPIHSDQVEVKQWLASIFNQKNPYSKKVVNQNHQDYVAVLYDGRKEAFAITDPVESSRKVKLGLGEKRVIFRKPALVYYPKDLLPDWAGTSIDDSTKAKRHPVYGYLNLKKDEVVATNSKQSLPSSDQDWGAIKGLVDPDGDQWRYQDHFEDLKAFCEKNGVPPQFFEVQFDQIKKRELNSEEIIFLFKLEAVLYVLEKSDWSQNLAQNLPRGYEDYFNKFVGFESVLLTRLIDGRFHVKKDKNLKTLIYFNDTNQNSFGFPNSDSIPNISNPIDLVDLIHEMVHAYGDAIVSPDFEHKISREEEEFKAGLMGLYIASSFHDLAVFKEKNNSFTSPKFRGNGFHILVSQYLRDKCDQLTRESNEDLINLVSSLKSGDDSSDLGEKAKTSYQSNYYLIKFTRDINLDAVKTEMAMSKSEEHYLSEIGKILNEKEITLENLSSKVEDFLKLYSSEPKKYEEQAITLYENVCFLFERIYQRDSNADATEVPHELKALLLPITQITEVVPLLSLNPFHTVRRMNEPPLSAWYDGVEFSKK